MVGYEEGISIIHNNCNMLTVIPSHLKSSPFSRFMSHMMHRSYRVQLLLVLPCIERGHHHLLLVPDVIIFQF